MCEAGDAMDAPGAPPSWLESTEEVLDCKLLPAELLRRMGWCVACFEYTVVCSATTGSTAVLAMMAGDKRVRSCTVAALEYVEDWAFIGVGLQAFAR